MSFRLLITFFSIAFVISEDIMCDFLTGSIHSLVSKKEIYMDQVLEALKASQAC